MGAGFIERMKPRMEPPVSRRGRSKRKFMDIVREHACGCCNR